MENALKMTLSKKEQYAYVINTSFIFKKLCFEDHYKYLDRKYILDVIQGKFINAFRGYNEGKMYEKNDKYLLLEEKNYQAEKDDIIDKPDYFPFPGYYIYWIKNNEARYIVHLDSYLEIERQNKDFNFFFALQFFVTDLSEYDLFLSFHLLHSFSNDLERFKKYLDLICIYHKEILEKKHKELIEIFYESKKQEIIQKKPNKNSEIIQKNNSENPGNLVGTGISEEIAENDEENINKKDFTTARQVMAIVYLLEELEVTNVDKTEIARFIQFLTVKETGVKKIKDTSIYKRVKSRLSISDKHAEKDLQYIRKYFEALGLHSIVRKINKEIGSKE